MPVRLPRLTLFTGPNCSLCQIAKGELAKVRVTHPFDLKTINIYAEEGNTWKKRYAWWIPALHLEGKEIAKGRWDGTKVREALETWQKQENQVNGPFFVDASGITAEELAWTAYLGGHIYHRWDVSVLGANEDGDTSDPLDRRNRCFNCGSPQHSVSACPEPINRPLIALSRGMHNFFKTSDGGEPERLHEYEERKVMRLRFCDTFDPGLIRGDSLRDALGLDDSAGGKTAEEKLSWFSRMLQWGYPPGWVGDENPKLKVRSRIEGEDFWMDYDDATLVIDNLSPASSTLDLSSVASREGPEAPTLRHSVSEDTKPPKRWARYPTTLFSSEHLAIYTGWPLPPLNPLDDASSTFTSDRQSLWERIVDGSQSSPRAVAQVSQNAALPPWRRPGAFSAFGPIGWQDLAQVSSSGLPSEDAILSTACSQDDSADEAGKSDMELSE